MKAVGDVDVESLLLDDENPRLPEELWHRSQEEILDFLYKNEVLKELAESFLENDFFPNEPLLVLPEVDGRRVVVEGNRRLAALTVLLKLPVAEAIGADLKIDRDVDRAQVEALHSVPAVEVESREALSAYLGFRHISGLKTWSPEAKARYVHQQVEAAQEAGSSNPFYEIGRKIGSHAGGIRSMYLSYEVLRFAREEFALDEIVRRLLDERFSVWHRLLGTRNVPDYIGLGDPSVTYEGVKTRVASLDGERLREVVTDLVPDSRTGRAVLSDSRDVTLYSEVLANERAHETLRKYDNLELAGQIVIVGNIGKRIGNVRDQVEVLVSDVGVADSLPTDAGEAVRSLSYQVSLLEAGVKARLASQAPDA